MRRHRHQEGSLRKENGNWVGQWWEWEDGKPHHRKKTFGRASEMTKGEAQTEFDKVLIPLNAEAQNEDTKLSTFIDNTYLPFYRRKWKESTAETNEDRVRCYIVREFGEKLMRTFTRDGLQDFLDELAKAAGDNPGLAANTIAHIKFDLNQIFSMAREEGLIKNNPASLLFVPREAATPKGGTMTLQEMKKCLAVLGLRERLFVRLATIEGKERETGIEPATSSLGKWP